MTWPVLFVLALIACLCLHLWWRARYSALKDHSREDMAEVKDNQRQTFAEFVSRQEALFNSMPEAVLLLDAGGRIEFANTGFLNLFGVNPGVRGKSVIEALRLHEVAELARGLGENQQFLHKELRLARPTERWIEVNGSSLRDTAGRPSGSVLVFHDLTRLKQLESTRKEFVANVSHELRTPLSLIKGYVETLLDGAKDSPQTAERFLRTIQRNADRLQLIIEDLLVISEVESGRVNLSFQTVHLKGLVSKVLDDFKAKAGSRNVEMVNEIPDFLVRADPGRLEQVISNIVDNAIKYGRQGGALFLSARPLEDHRVEVSIQDNGPGIPPEALERIFERFYRVDKSRSREQGGTGLGLAIVKHIVQGHGGTVWAVSRLGDGSTFFFTLPRAEEKKPVSGVLGNQAISG